MYSYVGVSGVWVQALANHQDGLPMSDRTRPDEMHIGGDGNVAGHALPHVLESVRGSPNIRAASGDAVLAFRRIEVNTSGFRSLAHICMAVEYSDCLGGRSRAET